MQAEQEMGVVEVSGKMLKELEDFGFPKARAVWALHHSGNSSLEAAVNWIIDHENDSNFDNMPEVEITIDIESSEPSDITEAMKAIAEELRDGARKKREEEEKKRQREREKERIRAGKELMKVKRAAEDKERQRNLALRKKEQEEKKRARERILQKLEADKLERRRRLGLPAEPPKKPTTAIVSDEKNNSLENSVRRGEEMRECLRSLRRNNIDNDARVKRAFQTLLTFVGNVAANPDEEKYRRIRLTNPLVHERVGSLKGGIEFLELCGFQRMEGNEYLHLPRDEVDISVLREAAFQLKSAITNPFFGILSKPSEF